VHIVLLEPEIPPNTGNVARLCAATHSVLHLIGPLGFRLDDSQLKRAGMDYWEQVDWTLWESWASFAGSLPTDAHCWFVEQGGGQRYDAVDFGAEDYLVFGRESAGLPKALVAENVERCLEIPVLNPQARSLNLSNCVALVLYEALRQQGFGDV
jgi:tRNA (cytidine/uridine-2'-O-)-methyltransferase